MAKVKIKSSELKNLIEAKVILACIKGFLNTPMTPAERHQSIANIIGWTTASNEEDEILVDLLKRAHREAKIRGKKRPEDFSSGLK